jgi:hypothetical protein
MKTKKQIEKEIQYCIDGMIACSDDQALIYQGWVEALDWVRGKLSDYEPIR